MDSIRLFEAKRFLQHRLEILNTDARRAFEPIPGLQAAPIPVLLHIFSTVELLSGLWAGWHDKARKPSSDTRTPLRRTSDFLETYLCYPQKQNQVALSLWKNGLTREIGKPILRNENFEYEWKLCRSTEKHWTIEAVGEERFVLYVGVEDLISDLKEGLFGPSGLFEDLRIDHRVQTNWQTAILEIQQQGFRFEA
ncbi:MAG: hypothetical protein JW937_08840 [Candidatus Omnitrophica bacterium]|nr:hypothetical protein [Candidatus Omnitrophota bacterium]